MPAPSTVLHVNALRTTLATAVRTAVLTGSAGDATASIYDDDDNLLVVFDVDSFAAVASYGFVMDSSPLPTATSETHGGGARTPTYAIIKDKDGDEVWRTPSVSTTPATIASNVPVRLDSLSYTAPV